MVTQGGTPTPTMEGPGGKSNGNSKKRRRSFYYGKKPAVIGPVDIFQLTPALPTALLIPSAGNQVGAKPKQPKSKVTPKTDGNTKKGGGKKGQAVGKTVGNFQCTSEDCRKTWNSVHAWTSERFECGCGGKAKVTKFVDGPCELDTYNCKACSDSWQSVHDKKTLEETCYCGAIVEKNPGTQIRHGKHYFYRCVNRKECGKEWEDFYAGRNFTQRCKKCGTSGEMYSVSKMVNVRRGGKAGGIDWVAGGGHDIAGCDMCQILRAQGISQSCKPKKWVLFEVQDEDNSNRAPKVLATR